MRLLSLILLLVGSFNAFAAVPADLTICLKDATANFNSEKRGHQSLAAAILDICAAPLAGVDDASLNPVETSLWAEAVKSGYDSKSEQSADELRGFYSPTGNQRVSQRVQSTVASLAR